MKRFKSEKGSVATFVIVTVLFFVAILSSLYMIVATLRKGQLKSQLSVKSTYERDLNRVNEIIENMEPSDDLPSNDETKPYLPEGFTKDKDTDLDNGLVIEDEYGNQYVWIEVPRKAEVYTTAGLDITVFSTAELNSIKTDLIEYAKDYRQTNYDDNWYDGCGIADEATYTEKYNKMLKSVYQNGGFWIGRYEIGIDEDTARSFYLEDSAEEHSIAGQTPVIKKNKIPYNWIRCSQAESLAETFAPRGHTSSLMFGLQWDLVCKHLETKGTNPGESADSLQDAIKTNSEDWGNHYGTSFKVTNTDAKYSEDDGATWNAVSTNGYQKEGNGIVLFTTGADTRNSMLNIYDLAGNLWEWTLEKSSNSNGLGTGRGGYYEFERSS